MDPRSEVLLRQAELFQGDVLLVGLPADDLLGRLPNAHGWSWHAGDQSKDLTDYLLNAVAARLPGKELYLVGEKKGGIESAAKQLNPFGKPRKLDNA
eukprot:gene23110-27469_t